MMLGVVGHDVIAGGMGFQWRGVIVTVSGAQTD